MIARLCKFMKGPVVNLTYIWECFPGKVNITVVAESKQSNACPGEVAEQHNLNWKDTVVKSLLVEVSTCKVIELFQVRNRQCLIVKYKTTFSLKRLNYLNYF